MWGSMSIMRVKYATACCKVMCIRKKKMFNLLRTFSCSAYIYVKWIWPQGQGINYVFCQSKLSKTIFIELWGELIGLNPSKYIDRLHRNGGK